MKIHKKNNKKHSQKKKSNKKLFLKKKPVKKQNTKKQMKRVKLSKKYQSKKIKMKMKGGSLYPNSKNLGMTTPLPEIPYVVGPGAKTGAAFPDNHYEFQGGKSNALAGSLFANVNTSLGGMPPSKFVGYKETKPVSTKAQKGGSGMLTNLVRQGGYELGQAYTTLRGVPNDSVNPNPLEQPISHKELKLKAGDVNLPKKIQESSEKASKV